MHYLGELLSARKPASITTVSFLDKSTCHDKSLKTDICGFEIPDEFVVGTVSITRTTTATFLTSAFCVRSATSKVESIDSTFFPQSVISSHNRFRFRQIFVLFFPGSPLDESGVRNDSIRGTDNMV